MMKSAQRFGCILAVLGSLGMSANAAVPNYWTPSAGVGFHFGHSSSIRLSYDGDFGHSYHANGAALTLILAY